MMNNKIHNFIILFTCNSDNISLFILTQPTNRKHNATEISNRKHILEYEKESNIRSKNTRLQFF